MAPALVATIVPVYNGERYLAQALDSALGQTITEMEIIVVDDGSSDGSRAVIDRYRRANPARIRVIHQLNKGVSSARNAAIAISDARYLALLDQDDIWLPHHLADCIAILESQPEVGLVHADIEKIDAAGQSHGRYPRHWHDRRDTAFNTLLLRLEHVSAPTAVFRHALIDQVGDFDPAFDRVTGEDRDLWLRLAEVSRLHYLHDVHARYRLHVGNTSGNPERNQRGRLTLIDKFTRWHPDRRHLRRRAIAYSHCSHGDELLLAGQRARAIRAYATALLARPIELRALKSLARSLLNVRAR